MGKCSQFNCSGTLIKWIEHNIIFVPGESDGDVEGPPVCIIMYVGQKDNSNNYYSSY
jgi:hypothetical protein